MSLTHFHRSCHVPPTMPRCTARRKNDHSWPASQPNIAPIWYPLSLVTICIQGLQNLRRTSHPPCRQVVSFEAPEVVVATSDGGVKLDPTRKIILYGGVVDPSSGVVEQSGDLLWSQVGNTSCSTPVPTVPPTPYLPYLLDTCTYRTFSITCTFIRSSPISMLV